MILIVKRVQFLFLYSIIACFFLLLSLEVLLRSGFFSLSFSTPVLTICDCKLNIVLDREVLFKIKPYSGRDINSLGYRDFNFKKKEKKRIIFLGDSFVMGLNVRSAQTMPKVLEHQKAEGYEVLNMGVQGYGPDQSFLQLEKEGLALDPDLVILAIYPANDFNDIIKNRLFTLDENKKVTLRTDNIVKSAISNFDSYYLYKYLLFKYDNNASTEFKSLFMELFNDINDEALMLDIYSYVSQYKISLMKGILKKFQNLLSKKGIPFLVVIIPSIYNVQDTGYFNEIGVPLTQYFTNEILVKDICKEESIHYINLFENFKMDLPKQLLYDRKDGHFTVYGNAYVARIIDKFLSRQILSPRKFQIVNPKNSSSLKLPVL